MSLLKPEKQVLTRNLTALLVSPTNFINSKIPENKTIKSKLCWTQVTLLEVTKLIQILMRLETLIIIITRWGQIKVTTVSGNK